MFFPTAILVRMSEHQAKSIGDVFSETSREDFSNRSQFVRHLIALGLKTYTEENKK